MQHTFEFKLNESKGFDSYKGNIRSEYIQASFMTLEELFVKLAEFVRFDIEISESFPLQRPEKNSPHKLTISSQSIRRRSRLTIGLWIPTLWK